MEMDRTLAVSFVESWMQRSGELINNLQYGLLLADELACTQTMCVTEDDEHILNVVYMFKNEWAFILYDLQGEPLYYEPLYVTVQAYNFKKLLRQAGII